MKSDVKLISIEKIFRMISIFDDYRGRKTRITKGRELKLRFDATREIS